MDNASINQARGRTQGQLHSLALGRQNRELYTVSPTLCVHCQTPIEYEKRRNKFCSSSCSASYNNTGRSVSESTRLKKRTIALVRNIRPPARTAAPYEPIRCCVSCNVPFKVTAKQRHKKTCSKSCKVKYLSQKQKQYARIHPELTYRRNPYKQSYLERTFEGWLINNGMTKGRRGYLTEVWFRNRSTDKLHRADFVFPIHKVIVELDGQQHEQTKAFDGIRDQSLIARGWTVIRISHKEFRQKVKIPLVRALLNMRDQVTGCN